MSYDVMMPVRDRLEFCRWSISSILDCSINKLVIIDDQSSKKTKSFLDHVNDEYNRVKLIHTNGVGVFETMNVGINHLDSEKVIKVDNDIVLLPEIFKKCERYMQGLDGVGLPVRDVPPKEVADREIEEADFLGGVFLFKRKALQNILISGNSRGRYYGFTNAQKQSDKNLAWLNPPFPVIELDRTPQFINHTKRYIEESKQRELKDPVYSEEFNEDFWTPILDQVEPLTF